MTDLQTLKQTVQFVMQSTTNREKNYAYAAAEILAFIRNNLNKQGCRATKPVGSMQWCAYRSGSLKCAMGMLIADEEYHPEMENKNAESIIDSFIALEWLKPFKAIIGAAQEIHDNEAMWGNETANACRNTAFKALVRSLGVRP